jgi:hypothetical protein
MQRKSDKISRRSLDALFARGIDSTTAKKLLEKRHTVSKLKSYSTKRLKQLGLSDNSIQILVNGNRPPIPQETVIDILFSSKSICCVCRDPDQPIIIHHIEEWSDSKDHSRDNLAVLCVGCHDKAHTQHKLSQNLTANKIKDFRQKWERQVREKDADVILGISNTDYARWDYVNHLRVFELAKQLRIDLRQCNSFSALRRQKITDSRGIINDLGLREAEAKPHCYMYSFGGGLQLYDYISDVITRILGKIRLYDITNSWSRNELSSILSPDQIISCQGAHYFKKLNNQREERNQLRRGYRQKNGICLDFSFDAWEATSSSSWAARLAGRTVTTSICIVRSIEDDQGVLRINATCLALGTHFTRIDNNQFPIANIADVAEDNPQPRGRVK